MFCPQCGSTQSDDLRFCKSCGANLHALRRVMASREDPSKGDFDWSKTWVAEMFASNDEQARRKAEIARAQGLEPGELDRMKEVKGGVITASVGFGVTIFLFFFMQGLIASGRVDEASAYILSRIWLAGLIPLLIGFALIFNGMVVSKKFRSRSIHETDAGSTPDQAAFMPPTNAPGLPDGAPFSVTDATTRHLEYADRDDEGVSKG